MSEKDLDCGNEIDRLTAENEVLREEVERLQSCRDAERQWEILMMLVGEDGLGSVEQAVTEIKQERDQLKVNQAGVRDMLREAAKQFRLLGQDGHAELCDRHANQLRQQAKEVK